MTSLEGDGRMAVNRFGESWGRVCASNFLCGKHGWWGWDGGEGREGKERELSVWGGKRREREGLGVG